MVSARSRVGAGVAESQRLLRERDGRDKRGKLCVVRLHDDRAALIRHSVERVSAATTGRVG